MPKRHLFVGVAMLVASAVSYGLAQMIAATPAVAEVVDAESASVDVTMTASPMLAVPPASVFALLESTPDAVTLLITGALLLGAAAGVRRRAC